MKIELSGDFLKAEDVKGGEIVMFTDSGITAEITSPEKKVKKVVNFGVRINDDDKTYTPNKTALQILIEAFGDETEEWVGRKFKITLVKVNVFGSMKNSIVPEPLKEKEKVDGMDVETVKM